MVSAIILLVLLCLLIILISSRTQQIHKRGCGRGCATCGNRFICHRGEYGPESGGKKSDPDAN